MLLHQLQAMRCRLNVSQAASNTEMLMQIQGQRVECLEQFVQWAQYVGLQYTRLLRRGPRTFWNQHLPRVGSPRRVIVPLRGLHWGPSA